jgi:hypothetical protein
MEIDKDLDRPIYGAPAIGRAANLVDGKGEVELAKVYRALQLGHIDADKFGLKLWVTTLRRILAKHAGRVA